MSFLLLSCTFICVDILSYPTITSISSVCKTDNIDLITKTRGGSILTSTAMDSLEDPSVYFGKDAQWSTLQKNDCITNTICFGEEERILSADLFLAKGQEQTISHKFCFAVSTGACGTQRLRGPTHGARRAAVRAVPPGRAPGRAPGLRRADARPGVLVAPGVACFSGPPATRSVGPEAEAGLIGCGRWA